MCDQLVWDSQIEHLPKQTVEADKNLPSHDETWAAVGRVRPDVVD